MNLDQGLLKLMSSPSFQIGAGILGRADLPVGQAIGGTMQDMMRYQIANQQYQAQQAAMAAAQEKQRMEQEKIRMEQEQAQARAKWMQQNMPHLMNAPQAFQNEAFKAMHESPKPPHTTGGMQWNPQTQSWSPIPGWKPGIQVDVGEKTGGLDFKNESALRDEYLKATKDYWPVRDSFERVQASIEDPSAAGDMALIFNYMKMLDPGSTVREGEFATAQNSGSIPKRLQALYNNAISGQRFTPEQRADFADRAQKLFQKQHNKFGITNKYYSGLASSYNFDPARIIRDMGELNIERQQSQQAQKEPDEVRVINGVTYHRYGKDWMQE